MALTSKSLRFPAWAGTGRELQQAIRALRENALPDGRLSVMIRSFLAPERQTSVDDLASNLPKKDPFQLLVKVEDGEGRRLHVVLGPDLPNPAPVGEDESEEDLLPGNIITAEAATSDETERLADRALEVLGRGIPRWGQLKEKGHMNILRLENLAALALVTLGFLASLIVVWPLGWFFGLFVSLVLLFIGLEVVEKLFPPFEIHAGRPRWRRRWWPAALLVGIPLTLAITLRILLGPWGGSS
jgi:hypothetical protein